MGNLTSTLDIVLTDDVTKNAAQIDAALRKIAEEAKSVDKVLASSGASDKFGASLKRLGADATHVQAATKAMQEYASAQGLAANRGDWTKAEAAGYRNLESVTVAGVRAIMGAERALEEQRAKSSAEHQRQIAVEQRAVERQIANEHRLQERQAEQAVHGAAHHGIVNYGLQAAALAVSAHGIMSVIERTVETGAEYQHRLVALRNSGRTPEEIEEMQRASHATIAAAPTARLSENLEILNETVGAFGSVEHALDHLTFMNKAAAVLHASAGDKITETAGQMGNQFARFFEMRGTAGNSKLFESEAGEMMRSMVFSGGNVNPRELLLFAQQAKSALQNYDIKFLSRVAPSIIGEVGGEKAGTQANAFAGTILGKARDGKQTEAWIKYGLLDPTQTIKGSKGPTGWNAGAIYHTDEFLSDPLSAMRKYVLPALAAKGIDVSNKLELTKAFGTMFRNTMANAFANELAQAGNIQRLDKDAGLIDKVDDYDAIYKRMLATDPTVAFKALTGSLENLMTSVSSPMMGTAALGLSTLAQKLNDLAVAAHNNPGLAVAGGTMAAGGALAVAGTLAYKLSTGFGLGTAATALEGAAGALDVAAGRLSVAAAEEGAGGLFGGVKGAAKGALGVEALEVAATGAVTLTAGSVALIGLTAAAIIAGIRASMEPKHQAASDPGFGNPFAPVGGIDVNDPKLQANAEEAKKPWYNRDSGRSRRGYESEHHDLGPHYQDLKNAPYFATAPLGPDGHPLGSMPNGWFTGRSAVDPTTGSRIGWSSMPTNPDLYSPSNVPLPPTRPEVAGPNQPPAAPIPGIENRTFGRYLDATRPLASAGEMPQATPAPHVDTSAAQDSLLHLMSLSTDAGAQMQTALNVTASPTVDTGSISAALALAQQLISTLGQAGAAAASAAASVAGASAGAGGPNASVGARRSFNRAPLGATTA